MQYYSESMIYRDHICYETEVTKEKDVEYLKQSAFQSANFLH